MQPDLLIDRWLSLVTAVERLASAGGLEAIIEVVRETARNVSGADGVTFVLRDGDCCYYVDEDAVGPLWKGRRFPLTACISGWCMLNDQMAVIPDIYVDPRIPHEAYRPTFVRSLVMAPVGRAPAIAAIGSYWSENREFEPDEVALIEGLSRSTAAAISAAEAHKQMRQMQERLASVGRLNAMGETVAAIAHELKQPLSAIAAYVGAAQLIGAGGEPERLDDIHRKVLAQTTHANEIIQRVRARVQGDITLAPASVSEMVAQALAMVFPDARQTAVQVAIDIAPEADRVLADVIQIEQVLVNLVRNAAEAMAQSPRRELTISAAATDGLTTVHVADCGPGLAPQVAERLFQPFVTDKSNGMGIGLSISRNIIEAHGGRIWVEASPAGGACFVFTLRSVADEMGSDPRTHAPIALPID